MSLIISDCILFWWVVVLVVVWGSKDFSFAMKINEAFLKSFCPASVRFRQVFLYLFLHNRTVKLPFVYASVKTQTKELISLLAPPFLHNRAMWSIDHLQVNYVQLFGFHNCNWIPTFLLPTIKVEITQSVELLIGEMEKVTWP